jgi:hypothetical protein
MFRLFLQFQELPKMFLSVSYKKNFILHSHHMVLVEGIAGVGVAIGENFVGGEHWTYKLK